MNKQNNPWISGSFYLSTMISLIILLMVVVNIVPTIAFPLVLIGGLIAFSVVGAFQLKNDQELSEKSFLELMMLAFSYIPFIKKKE